MPNNNNDFPLGNANTPFPSFMDANAFMHKSPLANNYKWQTLKYNSTEIADLFFPSAKYAKYGNADEIETFIDTGCKGEVIIKEFYITPATKANADGTVNIGENALYKVKLSVSTDATKLEDAWDASKAEPKEVLLYVEDNKNDWSPQKMYAKFGDIAKAELELGQNSTLINYLSTQVKNLTADKLNRLIIDGKVEYDWEITKSIVNCISSYFAVTMYIPDKLGDLCQFLGNGISDNLTLPESAWNSDSKDYWFKKETLIQALQIDAQKLNAFLQPLLNNSNSTTLNIVGNIINNKTNLLSTAIAEIVANYNQTVIRVVETIFEYISKYSTKKREVKLALKYIKYNVAKLCGMWNGIVDFIGTTLHFIGSILKTPSTLANKGGRFIEMLDNLTDNIRSINFDTIQDAIETSYNKILQKIADLKIEAINTDKLGYYIGYGAAFIASCFIPFTQIAKLGKVAQAGRALLPAKYLEEISAIVGKAGKAISNTAQGVADDAMLMLNKLLSLLSKGKEELVKFFDEILEAIVAWFKKSKNAFKKLLNLSESELDWMAARKIGSWGGNILKETQIRKLRGLLKYKGFNLLVEGDIKAVAKLFKPIDNFNTLDELILFMKENNFVGMFHAQTGQMILRAECTELVAFHELSHLKHFEQVGELYFGLSKVDKEMYVWKQIISQSRRWTKKEIEESLNYVNGYRKRAGMEILKLK